MASTPETELKSIPASADTPKKVKPKKVKKAQSVNVTFTNKHFNDLDVGGFSVKSGTSKKFLAHIGEAIKQTPTVANYIRLGWLEVS